MVLRALEHEQPAVDERLVLFPRERGAVALDDGGVGVAFIVTSPFD